MNPSPHFHLFIINTTSSYNSLLLLLLLLSLNVIARPDPKLKLDLLNPPQGYINIHQHNNVNNFVNANDPATSTGIIIPSITATLMSISTSCKFLISIHVFGIFTNFLSQIKDASTTPSSITSGSVITSSITSASVTATATPLTASGIVLNVNNLVSNGASFAVNATANFTEPPNNGLFRIALPGFPNAAAQSILPMSYKCKRKGNKNIPPPRPVPVVQILSPQPQPQALQAQGGQSNIVNQILNQQQLQQQIANQLAAQKALQAQNEVKRLSLARELESFQRQVAAAVKLAGQGK